MNRTLKYNLLLIMFLSLISCGKTKDKNTTDKIKTATATTSVPYVWPDSIRNIFLIPDTITFWDIEGIEEDGTSTIIKLWTPEQKALAQLIMSTVFDNTKVVNNRLKLDISREDFVNQGIPEPYYDFMLEKLKNLNTLEEKGFNLKNKKMEEIWENTQISISRQLFKDENTN